MASDSKVVLQRKSSKNATTKELMEQATMFISFMPGVTEILFYYVLMAVVKPFLILQRIYPNFMLALIGVNTDELVHTARSSSACFPVFQCTLSAA